METTPTYDFAHFGDVQHFQAALDTLAIPDATLARIVRVDRGFPLAVSATGTYRCELATHLMKRAKSEVCARPAAGDWIALARPADHEMAVIEAILPRTSEFLRKDPASDTGEQVVLANADIVFVVISCTGDGVNVGRLERALVMAHESCAAPYIILTKTDVCEDVEAQVALARSVAPNVTVLTTSPKTGEGVDAIKSLIAPNITAAMIGSSGVGKSTLINAMVGHERMATADVREFDDKGRHTTVAREIVTLEDGGVIIDTPGMRAIALWHADAGLAKTYPEIVEATHMCKFSDCTHTNEPSCGVKAALASGNIAPDRFDRYTKLIAELVELTDKQELQRRSRGEKVGQAPRKPKYFENKKFRRRAHRNKYGQ